VVSDSDALIFVHGADYLSVFYKPQRDALAMRFLQLRDRQNTAAEILWGVWLFLGRCLRTRRVSCRDSWASGLASTDWRTSSSASQA